MKRTKKILALVLAVALVLSTNISFGATQVQAASKKGKVTGIKVTNVKGNSLNMKKGASKVLKVSVKTSGKKVSKAYTFKSSNKKVVAVSKSGKNIKLKAKKNGTAKVTIKTKAKPKKTTVINVTVGQKVKSVKLNRSSAALEVGQSLKLSATVSPSKAINKKLKWESSNSGVATVNASGVVVANKEGTAVITAAAQDDSGKKATCTVTVKKVVRIQSVRIMDSYTLKITLTAPSKLTASNFVIKKKITQGGSYNNTIEIDEIQTSDNVTYYVAMKGYINNNYYLYVGINGLTGNAGTVIHEMLYTETENYIEYNKSYIKLKYNKNIDDDENVVDTYIRNGYATASWTQLPKGINAKYSVEYGRVYLSGKPTEKGIKETVFTFKDELGVIHQRTVVFMIYSDDNIEAAGNSNYGVTGADGKAYVSSYICVATKNYGNLKYEIVGDNYGMELTGEDDDMQLEGRLSAGTYEVKVKVTDVDKSLSTIATVKFYIQKGIKVTGNIKTLSGVPAEDVYVYTYLRYDSPYEDSNCDYTDENGNYTLYMAKGIYDIRVESEVSNQVLYEQNIYADRANVNFVINAYKVTVESSDDMDYYGGWSDNNYEEWYGFGSILYLKPGTYKIKCSIINGPITTTATLNITVKGDMKVKPSVTKTIADTEELTIGTAKELSEQYQHTWYVFTPETEGYYRFYSENTDEDNEIKATLYDDKGYYLQCYEYAKDFDMIQYCEAGKKYYLDVYSSSEETVKINVATSSEEDYNSRNDIDDEE